MRPVYNHVNGTSERFWADLRQLAAPGARLLINTFYQSAQFAILLSRLATSGWAQPWLATCDAHNCRQKQYSPNQPEVRPVHPGGWPHGARQLHAAHGKSLTAAKPRGGQDLTRSNGSYQNQYQKHMRPIRWVSGPVNTVVHAVAVGEKLRRAV